MSLKFNGTKLKEKREEAGLSLRALAGEFYKQFDALVAFQTIALWEDNRHEPGGNYLVMLARILGVQESFFYE